MEFGVHETIAENEKSSSFPLGSNPLSWRTRTSLSPTSWPNQPSRAPSQPKPPLGPWPHAAAAAAQRLPSFSSQPSSPSAHLLSTPSRRPIRPSLGPVAPRAPAGPSHRALGLETLAGGCSQALRRHSVDRATPLRSRLRPRPTCSATRSTTRVPGVPPEDHCRPTVLGAPRTLASAHIRSRSGHSLLHSPTAAAILVSLSPPSSPQC